MLSLSYSSNKFFIQSIFIFILPSYMKAIRKLTLSLSFLPHKFRAPFSVNNYMKTFNASQVTRYHGSFRVDEYNHFDQDEKAVQSFIVSEKKLYERESAKWKHITEEYYQISSSRRDTRISTVPQRIDQYEYFTKTAWKDSRQYSTLYRRMEDGQEQLLLDIMAYPLFRKYSQTAELLDISLSPSHDLLAFAVDLKNNQKRAYFIVKTSGDRKLISIGKTSSKLQNAHDLVFADKSNVYYIKSQNHRPCKLWWANIDSGETKELFFQQNEQFYLGLKTSKDKKYLLLSGVSRTGSKLWIMNLKQVGKLFKVWQGSGKVYINHIQNNFVVWIVKQVSEIKLIPDDVVRPLLLKESINLSKIAGQTIYSSPQDEVVEDIDLMQGSIVLYGYNVTKPILKILSYSKKEGKTIVKATNAQLPFLFGTISPCTNENYLSDSILFAVSTPFVYEEIYSYSLSAQKCKVVQKYEYTGPAIRSSKYKVQIIDVPATDAQKIPLTIIGPDKKKESKLLLNFYGCYGQATRVGYDNVTMAALQMGWTVCHAHVRGGNERGKLWHTQSQGDNRNRGWMDVQQCVGYLLREGYTHPSLLFLCASSAGAINLWNVILRKPFLYKGAIFKVPFLDVLSSLLDPSQPLSNTDYEQFGNPIANSKAYRQIAGISPYQNIAPIEYPAIHLVAGQNDYRTPVAQIGKFVSRFRDRAVQNGKLQELGIKGVTVDISSTASHLGDASIKDENYRGCDVFGYMDYVIDHCSKDCKKRET